MKKSKSNTPQPKMWLYHPVCWFSRLVSKFLFGLTITGRDQLPKDGPLLVLVSHQGMMDVLLVFAALRGRVAQFVATQRQFRHKVLGWFYTRLGAIPKMQFKTDPRCVMSIFRVLKNGGTVVLFPAGQTSMWGIPGNIAPSMAHLVKKAGVPVLTVGLRGSFFTAPRFGGLRFGKTEARMELTFTPEQLQALPEAEIYRILQDKLYYDEYAWQEETGALFRGKNLAEGYDQMLIYCPKCGSTGSWQSQGDTVTCTVCGNGGVLGQDLHMRPIKEGDQVLPTLKAWYAWQEEQVIRQVEEPGFSMEEPVTCRAYDEESAAYRDAGSGILRMDGETLGYYGTYDGKPVELVVRHAHLSGLSADLGVYVELAFEEYGLLRFMTANKYAVAFMKLGQEYLYRKTLG